MTLLQTTDGLQPRTTNDGDRMPLPKPHAEESRDDFVARCMKDPATQDITGANADETQSRRVAACERQFDEGKKDADLEEGGYGMKSFGDFALGDEATGDVTCAFATLGEIDNDREIVDPGAIPPGMKAFMSDYNHSSVKGQMLGTGIPDPAPVGKGVITTEGNRAIFKGRYFLETARGKEAYLTAKAMGPDARWSFAYMIEKTAKPSPEMQAKGARRVLTKLGSFPGNVGMEVSLVSIPGGVGTGTLSLKSAKPTASVDGEEHPAEDFAYVPDPEKPSTWKLPIFDKIHAQEAIDRFDQTELPASERAAVHARVLDAARKFGIDVTPAAGKKSADDVTTELRLRRTKARLGHG